MEPIKHPTIHHTELQPFRPGETLAVEWEVYRREVGRFLAEGYEGKHVLIEKPSVLRLQELDQLQKLAEVKGVLAKVVYHKLADPDHKKLRTHYVDGVLSESIETCVIAGREQRDRQALGLRGGQRRDFRGRKEYSQR